MCPPPAPSIFTFLVHHIYASESGLKMKLLYEFALLVPSALHTQTSLLVANILCVHLSSVSWADGGCGREA